MEKVNKWIASLALATVSAAVPAQAQTHCWERREAAAAQVREMQTMLMVAALRCRAAHIDISADYDGFVIAQRDAIGAANTMIKAHFGADAAAQADYDRFATSLANGFGDDATTEASCAAAATLAHEGSAALAADLEGLSTARVQPAVLPGGACGAPAGSLAIAAATPPEALPPVLLLAAPPADASGAVTLPADVQAALVVLARFSAQQQAPTATGTTTALAAVH